MACLSVSTSAAGAGSGSRHDHRPPFSSAPIPWRIIPLISYAAGAVWRGQHFLDIRALPLGTDDLPHKNGAGGGSRNKNGAGSLSRMLETVAADRPGINCPPGSHA